MHVHFMMDEFANVSLPDDFDKILSVMRSRGLSVSIILQNLAQLKALFEKKWESIVGNCDEFVYLGGNEQSTHKYVSELLGKETIDTNSYGRSDGLRGNFSTNYQVAGRELMTPDEVSRLDNKYAIIFIRGEHPVLDLKYDIMHHPNIKLGIDGGAVGYAHNVFDIGGINIEIINPADIEGYDSSKYKTIDANIGKEIEIYEDDELEKLCEKIEKEEEKKKNAKKQENKKENADAKES